MYMKKPFGQIPCRNDPFAKDHIPKHNGPFVKDQATVGPFVKDPPIKNSKTKLPERNFCQVSAASSEYPNPGFVNCRCKSP